MAYLALDLSFYTELIKWNHLKERGGYHDKQRSSSSTIQFDNDFFYDTMTGIRLIPVFMYFRKEHNQGGSLL